MLSALKHACVAFWGGGAPLDEFRMRHCSKTKMRPVHRGAMRWLAVLAVLALLVASNGCAGTPSSPTPPATTTGAAARTATPIPAATSLPAVTARMLPLTWWAPEFLSPQAAQPAGGIMAQQLAAFQAAQEEETTVNVVLKARYGKGGLLDFLRTAQPVAPSVLPDLVALDVIELEQAAAAGLLQPLDGLLDPELVAGLYPFAGANGRFNGRLLAVQLTADIEHVVYLKEQIETPPLTWPALTAVRLPYLFPVAGPVAGSVARPQEALTHAVLSQYLSAGAAQDFATRAVGVEAGPLARLLSFYAETARSGLLPPAALEVGDAETVWSVYKQNAVPMAYVSARHYLAEREGLKQVGYIAAPGYAAPARSLADGWALAIVTRDPARQQLAAELIAWLLQPQNAAAWSRAAGWLPTSPEALAAWGTDPYFTFLDEQLATAIVHPAGADYAQAAARIQKAVVGVIKGEVTPEQAAEAALAP